MSTIVPELYVEMAPFRALLRTDGAIAIIDDRKPIGQRTIALVESRYVACRVITQLALALARTT
jgi:hypothetical protein